MTLATLERPGFVGSLVLADVVAVVGADARVIDLGDDVLYPGFVDAHSHWIGDRAVMGLDEPAELFVNEERMGELRALDAAGELRVRVDGYLAMNNPAPAGEHLGDWYLDYDAGFAPSGPNDRRHRIEHAIQVTDEQLRRIVDLELVTVVQLAGSASDWTLDSEYLGRLVEPREDTAWLTRWRDFVDAGISVAAGVDAPWMFRDLALEPGVGTPMDFVAGAMDGLGHINPNPPEWVLDQTMTAEQALDVLARNADAVSDSEHRGRPVPGSYADNYDSQR